MEGRHFSVPGCGSVLWAVVLVATEIQREKTERGGCTEIVLNRLAVQLCRNHPSNICFLGRRKHVNGVPLSHI
jgi:hypothetical protein